jgi:hypothetical protein
MKRFLVADLEARVRRDWPASVAGVSYDNRGFLVVEYNLLAASAEGDVLGYMNRLRHAGLFCNTSRNKRCARRFNKVDDAVLAAFKLKRDVKTWGRIEGERVLFAWRPPWVKASLVELYYNCEEEANGGESASCLKKLKPARDSMLFAERSKSFGRVRRSPIGLPFRGPLSSCAMGFD